MNANAILLRINYDVILKQIIFCNLKKFLRPIEYGPRTIVWSLLIMRAYQCTLYIVQHFHSNLLAIMLVNIFI